MRPNGNNIYVKLGRYVVLHTFVLPVQTLCTAMICMPGTYISRTSSQICTELSLKQIKDLHVREETLRGGCGLLYFSGR